MEADGWRFVGPAAGLALVCLGFGWRSGSKILISGGVILALLALFCAYFFRDPERTVPEGAGLVVSPADGKILSVENDPDGRIRIAIFLSVLDVHINRAPISGTVTSVEFRPGKFLKAFDPRASKENEQAIIVIDSEYGPVEFSLIAGILARHVVCRVDTGDQLTIGQRVGLIRFGSRAEVVLPAGTPVLIKPGDRVKGAETALARFTSDS